ncbi:hypothetical protein A3I51_03780 [Candidatus Gottesmanbacteria bacterium RIFCSPLOWO2_02_FULL_38_8]|uniref:Peptidase S1 domain-containing protein n=1 Tax=Candidatus Gottesmanbacteria bacterium RIFCSPLOWO2_02_FULL_38_8 TaxID=1798397 RepID=A0A1F6B243_9BACT|nr:MAG: hypothetical protein A3I51_03780 [Candidatus Gottesmanbacteria bacterium RIFCSPLOWO2_02_FULL_38_8]
MVDTSAESVPQATQQSSRVNKILKPGQPANVTDKEWAQGRQTSIRAFGLFGLAFLSACSGITFSVSPTDNTSRIEGTAQALSQNPEQAKIELSQLPLPLQNNAIRIIFESNPESDGTRHNYAGSGVVLEETADYLTIVGAKHVLFPGYLVERVTISQPHLERPGKVFVTADFINQVREDNNELAIYKLKKDKPDMITNFSPFNIQNNPPINGDILFSLSFPLSSEALGWFPSQLLASTSRGTIEGMDDLIITKGIGDFGSSGGPVFNQDQELVGFVMGGYTDKKIVGITPITPYLNNLITKLNSP